jgi:hypothetical protein
MGVTSDICFGFGVFWLCWLCFCFVIFVRTICLLFFWPFVFWVVSFWACVPV